MRVTVVFLCVYLCVCYQASGYIPGLYVENKVLLSFPWHFQDMHCVKTLYNVQKFWQHLLTTTVFFNTANSKCCWLSSV